MKIIKKTSLASLGFLMFCAADMMSANAELLDASHQRELKCQGAIYKITFIGDGPYSASLHTVSMETKTSSDDFSDRGCDYLTKDKYLLKTGICFGEGKNQFLFDGVSFKLYKENNHKLKLVDNLSCKGNFLLIQKGGLVDDL